MDTSLLGAIRWSVLDRALVRTGQTPAAALRETVDFARHAERLGYHRFWVAEHHGVPGVAGSAPTVLAAAIAAATSRIRVGTGGVMLPNHRPFVIAEQFGVLESLFPGRIDMGLGRSVGFTPAVRRALGVGKEAAEGFGELLSELLSYFTSEWPVAAVPALGLGPPATFVLAIGAGADTAAAHGLPLVMAHLPDPAELADALDRYRRGFQPSESTPRPYLVLAVNVAVAATREGARLAQIPEAWASVWSRTRGVFPPLDPPVETDARGMTDRERVLFERSRASQLYGTEEEVAGALSELVSRTGADEVMVTLHTYDQDSRLDSYRRLARIAQLPGLGS